MKECFKRQKEVKKGQEQYRCLHKEADAYLQIVDNTICDSCPVRVFSQEKPCDKHKTPAKKVKGLKQEEPWINPNKLPVIHEGYPDCPYRSNDGDQLVCDVTGLPVNPDICHRCENETKSEAKLKEATFGEKIWNYTNAIRKWVAAGRPTRSEEEIKELFEQHCKNCDRYDKENHACKACGCAVATTSDPLQNKLAMKTEKCPLGRF